MSVLQRMFGVGPRPELSEDEIAIAQALAQFSLAAIGTEPGETADPAVKGSSFAIRNAVGNAYVAFVRAEAERVKNLVAAGDDRNEAQRKATVDLMAQTSLICGAMLNFVVSGFVRTKEERERILDTCFKDIRTRVETAQASLDVVRDLAATKRTPNGQ